MATVRTGAISESGIVFFSAGGHDHDGTNSSLINSSSYSIFDFSFGVVGNNSSRVAIQQNNELAFKNFIIKTVNQSVLEPAGVVLQDNIINSRNIIAGSITSNEIAANTITGNNIAASTITANNIAAATITTSQIAANTITGNNIAAGTITADKLQVGSLDAGSVTIVYPNAVPTGDFWASNGAFRLGGAAGINWTTTGDITFGSNVSITGSITSTGTISGGIVSGVQLTGSTGEIGGWDILSTRLDGGNTTLYSNGTIQCGVLRTGASGTRIELGVNIGNGEEIRLYSGSSVGSIRNNGGVNVRLSATRVADLDSDGWSTSGSLQATQDVFSTAGGDCGTSADPFAAVYATNTTIQSSDRRLKTDILDIPVGLDFIKDLKPVTYKWIEADTIFDLEELEASEKENRKPVFDKKPGIRAHYGLIAQDVKESVDKFNIQDYALWKLQDKDDPDSKQMLAYGELIAPMIKAIQELSARVEALEAELGYNS